MGGNCCAAKSDEEEVDGSGGSAPQRYGDQEEAVGKRPGKAKPKQGARSSGGAGGLNFDLALSDLEKAEMMVHGTAFRGFGSGSPVLYNNPKLMDYVATNSALGIEETETELLKAASVNEDMKVTEDDFMKVLRENAAGESAVLERFLGLSGGGEQIDSGECRSGLLMFMNDQLGAIASPLTENRWESIFDSVMMDAGAEVSMEGWGNYCRRVARVVRITHLGKL